nr:MAG TPA: hypothetical protein [Caudoviricetes sp.]
MFGFSEQLSFRLIRPVQTKEGHRLTIRRWPSTGRKRYRYISQTYCSL